MDFILSAQVIVNSFLGRMINLGKEKERTNHGKNCKEEGCSASSACEEEVGRQARRQRPSQAGCQARGPQVSGPPQGQGRLNRGKRSGPGARKGSGPGRDSLVRDCFGPQIVLVGVGDAGLRRCRRASDPAAPLRNTEPSISGASHLERPIAPSSSTSSTITSIVRPTFAAISSRLTACCAAMKRCQRSSFTSSGTAPGRALAAAPSTGSYLKQPTRASLASFSQSSSSSKSSSVSPGKPTMKVERMARSGQISRQRCEPLQRLLLVRGAAHGLEHAGRGVLEGDVEVGQDLALRHQRQHLVDVRVGIDVVQPHPGAERAQRLGRAPGSAPRAAGPSTRSRHS